MSLSTETKLALAKLLPEHVAALNCGIRKPEWEFFWKPVEFRLQGEKVTDREWLWVCHEIENKLTVNDWTPYLDALDKICVPVHICPTTHAMSVYCATAEERAEALLEVLK